MINSEGTIWKRKLEKRTWPRIVKIPGKWAMSNGKGRMLVPTPLLIDAIINKIPKGKLTTVNTICDYLAGQYHVDMTCPMTTGIFMIIAAYAAEESRESNNATITPYWRVLNDGGILNPKFPGGSVQQARYLLLEGFMIEKGSSRDKPVVRNFEKNLTDFSNHN